MKKGIGILAIIIVLILATSTVGGYKLLSDAQKIRVDVLRFKLLNLSSSPTSSIVLSIGNFSDRAFTLSQIEVNAYTNEGRLLAQQLAPLSAPIQIQPNTNTTLPLSFKINTLTLLSELKRIGGITSILANQATTGKNGIPIVLKGFISSGLFSKTIHEPLTV